MTDCVFISYGGERIPYRVNLATDRHAKVAIHVEPNGDVVVDAPQTASLKDIQKAVHKRARWVFSQVAKAHDRFRHVRPKEYVSGEEILYLGRRYMLKVVPDSSKQSVKLKGNQLVVNARSLDSATIKGKVLAWYRVRGRDYFDRRLAAWEQRLPWVEARPPFRLQAMEKRWGSCTPQGEIILNPHLIKAPRDCIDYVLLHELAHLRHHSHSPEFWRLIENSDPDWRRKKLDLDGKAEVLLAR